MIEFYPQIKAAHVGLVLLSGAVFATRSALVWRGSAIANHAAVRVASYLIDTSLLAAACVLMALLRVYPGHDDWLTVKVLLLLVYIVCGSFALKRARTPSLRLIFAIAAILTYLSMFGIARAHHPLGWLRWWGWA